MCLSRAIPCSDWPNKSPGLGVRAKKSAIPAKGDRGKPAEEPKVCGLSAGGRRIRTLGPGCEKAASSGNGTRAMPHRPSFSAPDDGFRGKLPIFPLGTLKLGDLRLRLGIPEAEVTDELPVGRDIKNFGHPCGIKDGNPAEANPLRTGS